MEKLVRPHEFNQVLRLLKTLVKGPNNTMAVYRELRKEIGFRNHHAFYRQLKLCLKYGLIEISDVNKKWAIPTKTYRLTEKRRNLLLLFKNETEPFIRPLEPRTRRL